jgi:hypothetical protein
MTRLPVADCCERTQTVTDEPDVVVSGSRQMRLTEAEWRKRQCRIAGHRFQVIVRSDGEPSDVTCGRCAGHWPVGPSP